LQLGDPVAAGSVGQSCRGSFGFQNRNWNAWAEKCGIKGAHSGAERREKGAENGAVRLASQAYKTASICTEAASERAEGGQTVGRPKAKRRVTLCITPHRFASICTDREVQKRKRTPQESNL
jgi:hypothetical protein